MAAENENLQKKLYKANEHLSNLRHEMDILRNPPGFRQFAKQVADLDEATENLMHFSDQKWEKLQHMSGLLQDWYSRSMSEKFEA